MISSRVLLRVANSCAVLDIEQFHGYNKLLRDHHCWLVVFVLLSRTWLRDGA